MKLVYSAIVILAVVIGGMGVIGVDTAKAVSATSFQPGRIIDDAVFYNKSAMGSAQAVQDFIASHTPACDTWGTQPSEYGGGTRAQYAASVGWPGPPYVCLQNYHESPTTGETSYEKGGGAFAGGHSAGQIIWDAAQRHGINPQVLLVMLKKEAPGPLFSDSWPLKSQYRYAMGYACPDSGPNYSAACVDSKAGFYKQVDLAAWQLRYYANNIGQYNYQPGRWNYIQHNPDPGCGGQNVYIENMATASLYIYTPYVPNAGALAAYPGTAHCGAYGNRNFFMFFNEWFGSTHGAVQVTSPLRVTSSVKQGAFTNRPMTFSFDIKNTSSSTQNIGDMMIAARDSQGGNHDFGRKSVVLAPGQTYTYSETRTFNAEETYTFSISNYRSNEGWSATFPDSSHAGLARTVQTFVQAIPTVEQVPAAASELRAGKTANMAFAIKNNSARVIDFGKIGMAVRGPNGQNLDLPYDTPGPIAAGATYQYQKSFTPQQTGAHALSIALTMDNGTTWNETSFPASTNGASAVQTAQVKPNPSIISGLETMSTTTKVGQKLTVSYTVTNFSSQAVALGRIGVFIRDPSGGNADPRWDDVTLQPSSSYVYTVDIYPNKAGTWAIEIGGFKNGSWTANILPNDPGVGRKVTVDARPNPVVSESVSATPAQPRVGQEVTLRYVVRNDGDMPVVTELTGLTVRDARGGNMDPGWVAASIAPRSTYTYTKVVKFTHAGNASISIGGKKNGEWVADPLPVEQASIAKSLQVNILPNPTIVEGITFTDPKTVGVHTLSFKIKNYANTTVNLGKMGLSVRDPQGRNYDAFWEDFAVTADSERVHSVSIPFDKPGKWTVEIGNYNGTWNNTNPLSENPQVIRRQEFTIY